MFVTYNPSTGIDANAVTWGSDNGSSCGGAMWSCVDDVVPDGDNTYVYATAPGGFHRVGYGPPVGDMVTAVKVHVVAAQPTATGTLTVQLYSTNTVLTTSAAHALTPTYAEYVDSFAIPPTDASTLRTKQIFSAVQGKYTQVYMEIQECVAAPP